MSWSEGIIVISTGCLTLLTSDVSLTHFCRIQEAEQQTDENTKQRLRVTVIAVVGIATNLTILGICWVHKTTFFEHSEV